LVRSPGAHAAEQPFGALGGRRRVSCRAPGRRAWFWGVGAGKSSPIACKSGKVFRSAAATVW